MSTDEPRGPGEIAEAPREDEALRDGIGEEDNKIPTWFSVSFYASILFAVVYVPYYHFSGWSQVGQWQAESAQLEQQFAAVRATAPTENPYHGNAAAIAEGQQTFATICLACHLADGRGMVGPSLVDPYWKYGHDDAALFETVAKGRPGGMPPWEAQLGAEKIWKVLAYIETLPKTEEPGLGAPDYVAPAPAAPPAPSGG